MPFTEDDHVVETFSPNRPDHSLTVRVLPRGLDRGLHFLHAEALDRLPKLQPEYTVIVAQDVLRRGVPRECLDQLASGPNRCGRAGHVEVNNLTAFMGEDQEDVQDLERGRRYSEEIDRNRFPHVVLEERFPGLRGRFPGSDHILGDRRLRQVNPELEKLAVDSRRSPR